MTRPDDASPILVWLRNDLRLDDNPALAHAAETGRPVVPIVILDEVSEGLRTLGGAHRWWLHHSLLALARSIEAKGARLILRRGRSVDVLRETVEASGAGAIWFNRRYQVSARHLDDDVRTALPGLDVQAFSANLLHDPEHVATKTGHYYKVYTPFRKNLEAQGEPRPPIDAPENLRPPKRWPASEKLESWELLPTSPDWSSGLRDMWTPGEAAAHQRFRTFCSDMLHDYQAGRQRPFADATSRMSPHLRWGEISPYRLWHTARAHAAKTPSIADDEIATFKRELIWRDFNYHVLFHFEDLPTRNLNGRFDKLQWRRSSPDLRAWQTGQTGYPIVDAGMRQLWQTGWMHNRVRMIVGSFLTRDLLLDWTEGEAWFWDTLVDGDIANNTSQWQWIAGTGADAQPFFRIFNPVTQSQTFDPDGLYIKTFVPELKDLPAQAIHAPWAADAALLAAAGVTLGKTYPRPIVDHGEARKRALAAYSVVKN